MDRLSFAWAGRVSGIFGAEACRGDPVMRGLLMMKLNFDKMGGLVPAVVQDYLSGEVLMLAFMDEEAWEHTLQSGLASYHSPFEKYIVGQGKKPPDMFSA